MRTAPNIALVALVWLGVVAGAQAIHKCTDANGKVTYSDAICPGEIRQKVDIVDNSVQLPGTPPKANYDPSKLRVSKAAAPLRDYYAKWLETERLGATVPRSVLAQSLLQIREQAAAAPLQACANDAKKAFLSLADKTLEAFGGGSSAQAPSRDDSAQSERDKLTAEFEQKLQRAC